MLKSMTGFGTASVKNGSHEVNAEIRTLNSKFADIIVRMPQQWSSIELAVRKQLTDGLVRGKISASVEIISGNVTNEAIFDDEMLGVYYKKFKQVSEGLGEENTDLFSLALHAPGVLKTNEENLSEDLSETIKEAIAQAIIKTEDFRLQEGEGLYAKLLSYSRSIRSLLSKIDPLDKERIQVIEERLRQGLKNAKSVTETDQNRFEQELIYYIEKLDINEETVRLSNHLDYFEEVMDSDQPNGKKLGFVSQEMGREINTIGSKANNAAIQRIVVEMKEELEKIKEQTLNLL